VPLLTIALLRFGHRNMSGKNLARLRAFDGRSKTVNIVVEVSKGARIKLKYDEENEIFQAEKALPLGLVFPFDFGFIPSTIGGDGDPLDALVLSEAGLPWGTVVLGKVLGILNCEQTEKGRKERNDRVIAVPLDAKSGEPFQPGVELDARLKMAISEFFVKYNELQGKKLRIIGFEGASSALTAIRRAMAAAERKNEAEE
jgi:inorganic pyrophosphatase